MSTERLYYQDSDLLRFEARVLRSFQHEDGWVVVLDRSAFYPEGGGQPADRGCLNGHFVLDVQEKEDEIFHVLSQPLDSERVVGEIDPQWRRDFMQQHTGQHIISAVLFRSHGYPTISSHLGDSYTSVEIEAQAFSEEVIEAVEDQANAVIRQNLPVRTQELSPTQVLKFDLRKPPPAQDRIRVVSLEGLDAVPCCGTHLNTTAGVGLIHFIGEERIRGRPRLKWKIGQRAIDHCRQTERIVSALSQDLTCGWEDIPASVRGLKKSIKEQGRQIGELERRVADGLTSSLRSDAEQIDQVSLIIHQFKGESPAVLARVFKNLIEMPGVAVILINTQADRVTWQAGTGEGISLPLERLIPPLLGIINGKGGGSLSRWQGTGTDTGGAAIFLSSVHDAVCKALSERELK